VATLGEGGPEEGGFFFGFGGKEGRKTYKTVFNHFCYFIFLAFVGWSLRKDPGE